MKMKPLSLFPFLIAMLFSHTEARPGPIEKSTVNIRQDIINKTKFVEILQVQSHPAIEGYIVLATQALDETKSRDLLTQFREIPFERVTNGQCHEPGFALRLLDSEKKLVAEISFCWKCHNIKAAQNSPEWVRKYQEDFAADSKSGKAFLHYLESYFSKQQ